MYRNKPKLAVSLERKKEIKISLIMFYIQYISGVNTSVHDIYVGCRKKIEQDFLCLLAILNLTQKHETFEQTEGKLQYLPKI